MTALYRRILGDAFHDLPPRLQAAHGSDDPRRWSGQAEVCRGMGQFARIIGWGMRLPPKGEAVPVSVDFIPQNGAEVWRRNFGGHIFESRQYALSDAPLGVSQERFGMIDVTVVLKVEDNRLVLEPVKWRLFGMPLPKALLPTGQSFEAQIDDRFVFDVEIRVPWIGRIVAYRGWLMPDHNPH